MFAIHKVDLNKGTRRITGNRSLSFRSNQCLFLITKTMKRMWQSTICGLKFYSLFLQNRINILNTFPSLYVTISRSCVDHSLLPRATGSFESNERYSWLLLIQIVFQLFLLNPGSTSSSQFTRVSNCNWSN